MRDPNEIICHCQEITLRTIKKAIRDGATTVEDIQATTEAGISCGVCIEEIEELLEEM